MMYILLVAALLGACDVIQDGGQHGRHIGFYQKLEIIKKTAKIEDFICFPCKSDIIKHFAVFCVQFEHYSPKKVKNTQFCQKMA